MGRKTATYTILIVASVAAIWAILSFGSWMHPPAAEAPTIRPAVGHGTPPIVVLLVQIGVILVAARAMGMLCRALGQPQVIGEMLAGIMLGPSLLGWAAPGAAQWLFPSESLPALGLLSQLGVILFLFLIGLELDPKLLRSRGHSAVLISHASIAAPFVLGAGLALYLFPRFRDQPGVEFAPVALFMGAAMSVTAFPVLARMLTERNLHRTELGAVTITCAAIDDATAWCMLAIVIGVARADGIVPGLTTAGLAGAYVLTMFFLVRPLLRKLQRIYERQGRLSQGMVGGILVLVLASAWITEKIGIHALFGAFMMGAMMPNGTQFVRALSEKIEDFTVTFLLPIFFANAGLKTRIGLISEPGLWVDTALIIGVACVGKFGGSAIAGRVSGLSWRDASIVGVLMNTRGLMELVILEIGLEEGVLTPTVFAMMVIMALVTTAMTSPLLSLLAPRSTDPAVAAGAPPGGFDILIPVAAPESGRALARVAAALLGNNPAERGKLLALHLVKQDDELFGAGLDELEQRRLESLEPILTESQRLRIATEPVSFPTTDVATDIAAAARGRGVSLILMGFHKPVFGTDVLGGVVYRVLEIAAADAAVFIDRGLTTPRRVLVALIGSTHDTLALSLAERMSRLSGANVTVLHVVAPARENGARLDARGAVEKSFGPAPNTVVLRVVIDANPVDAVLKECPGHDLLVIGVDEHVGLENNPLGWRPQRIVDDCPTSILIVRRRAERRMFDPRRAAEVKPVQPQASSNTA